MGAGFPLFVMGTLILFAGEIGPVGDHCVGDGRRRAGPILRPTLKRRVLVLFATAACAMPSACGGSDDKSGDGGSKGRDGDSAQVRLAIEAQDGRGAVKRAQLVCTGGEVTARGLAPDRNLCATARNLAPFLSAKPAADWVCTQIYGGPETAHISGQIEGRRHRAALLAKRRLPGRGLGTRAAADPASAAAQVGSPLDD